MKTLTFGAALLLAALSTACNDGSTLPVPSGPTVTAVNADQQKLSYDVNGVAANGYIDVEMRSGDVSILVNLAATDAGKGIAVTEIRDPNDTVIYSAEIDLNTGDIVALESEFVDAPYAGQGEVAVFLPPTPELDMLDGRYRFRFEREDDAPLRRAEALVKSAPAGGAADMQSYSARLNVWVAHPDAEFNDEAFTRLVQSEYLDGINRILAPHSLSIDTVSFFHATAQEVAAFADLDVDNDLGDACQSMLASVGTELAFNLVYVRELLSAEAGGIAGVSPTPGVVLDNDAADACFFVAQQAYVANPATGFTEDMANQMMAGNILHEASHFMSLEHPTEAGGDDFDHLLDTPKCDVGTYDGRDNPQFGVLGERDGEVSDFECGFEGGANNFLFYGGVPQFLPFEMSMDQAKVLRRHPLFIRDELR